MSFAPMTADDVDAVLAIEAAVQEFPWTRGNFLDALAAGYDAWVMREGDRLVGFAVLMHAVDEAHLLVIGIAPDRQRAGRGRALLEFIAGRARAAGMTRLLLEVRPSNQPALAFYRQAGFVEIGRRRAYYPAREGREDAIVMAREP
ncbi:ribosomal protein S18-alanine N-acetyltransferase [Sulfuricystis multivorans]|uniref:ribosomal protein S18-alanine N-acetyltransferase n=1 Tax=Sulfuricystis multivorans TaxID=2211108 RepID=UPI001559F950|nr:ribosomal protein S18-alanine N-acetyltransferase [Sulfuricystis multivorans]